MVLLKSVARYQLLFHTNANFMELGHCIHKARLDLYCYMPLILTIRHLHLYLK